ncbi:putative Maleylacetate reductase [Lasiosphaeria ovina]|uniref:Maleylacetate reductase n=1 Tax=Lasiosphaeria ovina TaxID=92902 RepID=A0AAE0K4L2_9PEZI|nr:putative Maleylacetate reductase [Lasiosphaeria ovina]
MSMTGVQGAVIDCTNSSPLSGLWSPQSHPKHLFYGPGCVQRHLLNVLPSPKSRVFIMAGQTLATQTPLIRQLEALLGSDLHAGTFAGIKQHGQTAGVDDALVQVSADPSIDTILSVGGGSPIDSAKRRLFDALFTRCTPRTLLLASGVRAIDHAVETVYHPQASLMPWKLTACWALGVLFKFLPLVAAKLDNGMAQPSSEAATHADSSSSSSSSLDDMLTVLMLAAYASSGLRGANLWRPYGISHGEMSCLTLAAVIRLKAKHSAEAASQISCFLLPAIRQTPTGDAVRDALGFARLLDQLVEQLGLKQRPLSERGIGMDQVPIIARRAVKGPEEKELRHAMTELVEALF